MSSHPAPSLERLTIIAMAAASFMLAHQVAGKAVRDALFLSEFPAAFLPRIVVVAAVGAILLGLLFSSLLSRFGPRRVVPAAFGASFALHSLEWLLRDFAPGPVAAFVYIHIVDLGAVVLSGFWALASEVFDPREAKLRFGRIAGVGTAGGIGGGILAERSAAWFTIADALLLLAALHLLCAVIIWRLGDSIDPHPSSTSPDQPPPSRREVFARAPFLISLAVLVFLGTTSAQMIDYLFKSGAAQSFGGKSPALLRYFALFYTGAQILTFLVQTFANRWSLEKLGLSRTITSLPFTIGAGSAIALLVPTFAVTTALRALELIMRGSLFRAGYELFYTPIPPREKRSVKVLIDVGCDRLGDAAGAAIVQLAIWLGPALARPELLGLSILFAFLSAWLARRLDQAYTGVLERGLIERAIDLDFADIHDSTTMSAVLRTVSLDAAIKPAAPATPVPNSVATPPAPRIADDPVLALLAELRSGQAQRVRTAIENPLCGDPALTPQLIRLLAWDEVSAGVQMRLAANAPALVGQLSDTLLNEREEFAIRRRIPRLLALAPSQRAVDALIEALRDPRFEVRFQCGRALDHLFKRNPALLIPEAPIFAVLDRELSVSRTIWDSHRLLDRREAPLPDESSEGFSFLDDILRERANQSLEHVFSLLSVVRPREPLRLAFRALHTNDRPMRGLALEYLESILPPSTRLKLWSVINVDGAAESNRAPQEVLDQLMLSNATLQLRLAEVIKNPASADVPQSGPPPRATPA